MLENDEADANTTSFVELLIDDKENILNEYISSIVVHLSAKFVPICQPKMSHSYQADSHKNTIFFQRFTSI